MVVPSSCELMLLLGPASQEENMDVDGGGASFMAAYHAVTNAVIS